MNDLLVLDGEGVGIEPAAVDQLARLARTPGCVRAVGLPDLHPGPGVPIGAAVALDRVVPALVGSDAGCGVRLTVLDRFKAQGDALERRVREATDAPPLPDVDAEAALDAIWRRGPRALSGVAGVPEELADLAAAEPEDEVLAVPVPEALRVAAGALGSIGGGNHFAELSEVDRVVDAAAGQSIGLGRGARSDFGLTPGTPGIAGGARSGPTAPAEDGRRHRRKSGGQDRHGAAVVLVHTGSRGLGALLADRWAALDGDPTAYLAELEGCVRFARANRLVLSWVLARAAGVGRADRVLGRVDLVHNTVVARDGAWVHRKGAAPAEAGALTVVLGSRGAVSWVLEGAGNPACLCCVAHGAGRRVTRGEAKARIRARHHRAELTRTATGTRVICDDPDLLYEEHPDCYKPIEAVIAALEAHGAGRRVASLRPLVTVKR
jgi:release factor H-coupled RctB family protein